MTYAAAISYLEQLKKFPATTSQARMYWLMTKLASPYKTLRYVHITGTNGKGSTAAFVAAIGQASGHSTGLFTSPHLLKYNERIKVNGVDISDAALIEYVERLQPIIEQSIITQPEQEPCLFEVLFAIALDYFCAQQVKLAVIEVGIGGKSDPTNIIPNSVAIITNVGLDHMALLGPTTTAIAADKAGIIKTHGVCITAEPDNAVVSVLEEVATYQAATLIRFQPEQLHVRQQSLSGQTFDFNTYADLHIPLLGRHQLSNAGLAILCAEQLRREGLAISSSQIRAGLRAVRWPLRFEIIWQNPLVVADVGHNPHGLAVIIPLIRQFFSTRRKIVIVGCSADKPWREMSVTLAGEADICIVTQAQYKAAPAAAIYEHLKSETQFSEKPIYSTHTVVEAVALAHQFARPEDVILILGGLYLATEGRSAVIAFNS